MISYVFLFFFYGKEFLRSNNFRKHLKFPSEYDLAGATKALMRLQDTYNISAANMVQGQLNGVQYR